MILFDTYLEGSYKGVISDHTKSHLVMKKEDIDTSTSFAKEHMDHFSRVPLAMVYDGPEIAYGQMTARRLKNQLQGKTFSTLESAEIWIRDEIYRNEESS